MNLKEFVKLKPGDLVLLADGAVWRVHKEPSAIFVYQNLIVLSKIGSKSGPFRAVDNNSVKRKLTKKEKIYWLGSNAQKELV